MQPSRPRPFDGSRFDRFDRDSVRAFCRLFGCALLASVATDLHAGVHRVHAGELYPWRHLPILPLYPPWALTLEWLVTTGVGLAFVLGSRLRVAARVGAVVTFVAVLERFSNHGALAFLVAFFVALDPPDLAREDFAARPHYGLGLVRAQLGIVYLFSAINKITHGFGSGAALLAIASSLPLTPGAASALSWIVILTELALPLVLVARPKLGVVLVGALHATFCALLPGLGSFGLTMAAMAILFVRSAKVRPPRESRADPRASCRGGHPSRSP